MLIRYVKKLYRAIQYFLLIYNLPSYQTNYTLIVLLKSLTDLHQNMINTNQDEYHIKHVSIIISLLERRLHPCKYDKPIFDDLEYKKQILLPNTFFHYQHHIFNNLRERNKYNYDLLGTLISKHAKYWSL